MIRYDLKCADGHAFDAWFRDSDAFDAQLSRGMVRCVVCGSAEVEKKIMAPRIGTGRGQQEPGPLSAPVTPAEAKLAELRKMIEEKSDYVGKDFADEARRIHEGEADARAIWGEASVKDAKSLHDDGIPVAPLPWMRRRDS